ncbi:hypothetical protein CDD81_855 [Ophiocordyceps australis]|uniref:BTB domain-containing protein n=1 Tax=Ophiocordyceps australis TaxID=1399860 RepID=A0A2C5Y056_9HYPO|nr:hypothetical protein CDD81_855 [Ophiocordyceps australis]
MIFGKSELQGKLGEQNSLIKNGVLREENPLDQSPEFNEFLLACRKGDLRTCQQLMSLGVNINGKDKYDYTPLIIASLCGHYELVRLLLESGALAERNTFQGERCIYNALNDRIRNLLLEYDFSKSSDALVYWSTHLCSLLTRTAPATFDFEVVMSDLSRFNAHKFLLAARTGFFPRLFAHDASASSWHADDLGVAPRALELVLRHVYLDDDWLRELGSAEEEARLGPALDRVSGLLGMEELWEAVLAARQDRRVARQRFRDQEARALRDVAGFFQRHVLGGKIVVERLRVDEVCWQRDNAAFADVLLCAHSAPPDNDASLSAPPTSTLYPAHKAMLIRSQYFATMFSGPFVESRPLPHLRIITMDCSPPVLALILTYLYTESINCPLRHALDLLYAADMLLLDGLKNKAAVTISTLGSPAHHQATLSPLDNNDDDDEADLLDIFDVLTAAWDLAVPRLEEFAARYIAARLESYIDDEAFRDAVRKSAARIRARHDTDSIELVDDVRFHLSERFRLRFEDTGLANVLAAAQQQQRDEKMGADAAAASHDDVAESAQNGQALAVAQEAASPPPDDDFAVAAAKYQLLLDKIDAMLEQLGLDA